MYVGGKRLRHAGRLLLLCAVVAILSCARPVYADTAIEVSTEMDGLALGHRLQIFEDPRGSRDIREVSAPEFAINFRQSESLVPNFGFSKSTFWIRFTTHNAASSASDWLLELAYPHLDQVSLFTPSANGDFDEHATGDLLPFGQRDLAYRNFVFSLVAPPHVVGTHYLRIRSTGALSVPLMAWTTRAFIEHQELDRAALWVFYGIVLIMAFYNACIYMLVRQGEFAQYVAFVLALGLLQFTFAGHTFQFLLPNHSWLANRILPASIGLIVVTGCHFADAYLGRISYHRALRLCEWTGFVLIGCSFVLPYDVVILLVVPLAIAACVIGGIAAMTVVRSGSRRGKLYVLAWGAFLVGAVSVMLRAEGLLPTNFLTTWSMQIGAVVQLALLSTVLADNINAMRADLGVLNEKLSEQVHALREALGRAEEATGRAEKATRVKDEFMATMSHEFRTPLNAIINIPQGLLKYFPEFPSATCSACDSDFEIEPGETISSETDCPECGRRGTMMLKTRRRYVGVPEHTAQYLGKIERSGSHLLQVVNGILDFSKLEAGQFRLSKEHFLVSDLVQEVVEQMNDLADSGHVALVTDLPRTPVPLLADPLRIRQVLINLVGNAIKFSDKGGTVTIQVTDWPNRCEIAVRDEGLGIAKDDLEAVFQSFEQVYKGNTRRYGGTGLGLPIARTLVRMHGGDLHVESVLGKGSTFYFDLPKQTDTTTPAEPQKSGPTPASGPSLQERSA